ncbi:MAG: hypothetical protein H7A46_22655 [Verrucomicrobiales bacterium]|nr:hypothetical protein [Verrucomicrobiales bacterium]
MLIDIALRDRGVSFNDLAEVRTVRTVSLCGVAVAYAIYRLGWFHPACQPTYARWLSLTPWKAGKPLPLGPVHPVWQDAVVLGVLVVLAGWRAHADPTLPLKSFGLAYLILMTALLAVTRRRLARLALGFLWPALLLPDLDEPVRATLVVAIVVVVWLGHRGSLKAFPWEPLSPGEPPVASILQVEFPVGGSRATVPQLQVGWPFQALSPKVHYWSISTAAGLLLSALMGWWCFCLILRFEIEPVPEVVLFLTLFAAFFRWGIYRDRWGPPFNLAGRIASRRIVLPGFDKILLTPLAAVLVAIVGAVAIRYSGSWHPAVESAVIALVCGVLSIGGPTLRSWNLTGYHRWRLPARATGRKSQLRPL